MNQAYAYNKRNEHIFVMFFCMTSCIELM